MSRAQSQPAQTRWGIVTTAKEVPDLLLAFAAHHASIGASRIYLYLDDPDPVLARRLSTIPGVEVTLCDETYWQMIHGSRPPGQENRQVTNAIDAYERTDVDWLIHIDADEFLNPTSRIAAELSFVPEEVSFVGVDMRERVYTPEAPPTTVFSGLFRVPFNRRTRAARTVFGDMIDYTQRGLSGQIVGKSFVRTGLDRIIMGIHGPRVRRPGEDERLISLGCNSATLLHFDGLTPAHWIGKMMRYGAHEGYLNTDRLGEHRRRQLEYVMQHPGNLKSAEMLHDLLKVLDANEAMKLRALGYIEPSAVDPAQGVHEFGLADQVDLSVTHFDSYYAPPEVLKQTA